MNSRPFTILIVSPDRTTLRRLSRFLEVFGYDVRQATDGPQAPAAAEAARPDFLIIDGSAGQPADLQLCRQVRRVWPQGYTYSLLLAEGPEVSDITAALEAGFDDFLAAPVVFGELLARLRAGARTIEFERRLSEQAGIDPATGLGDRTALATQLHERSQASKGIIGWLALVDLDYFQRVADRLGREGAQALVCEVATKIGECAGEHYFAAALGADRIGIVLPASQTETAVSWCQQTLATLSTATFTAADQPHKITASCGLTEVTSGEALDVVLARAQRALQLAKASGRNCVVTSGEVDADAEEWAAFAADGRLFQTTVARDVMAPCPLLIGVDEPLDQAHGVLQLTGLAHAPVIDAEGKLAGLVSLEQLAAARLKQPKQKNANNSIRLVRQVMAGDAARFDEQTPLATLMEFFTGESHTLAVVVRDKKPRGLVHVHGLAALNERLTAEHFATTRPRTATSEDLLVPDLAMAE
jgi:two-component system, cell cycle response regulator